MVDPPPLIRPTPGPLRAGFRYARATPFAAGQRRGTTFAARPGTVVVAPCRGRVTFAGRTPRGPAVTVRCGAWTTTVLGVAATVRAGASVRAGAAVGRAGDAVVGLSLRPVSARWGYVDPGPSLARPRSGMPLGRAPHRRIPRDQAPLGRAPRARRSPVPVAVSGRRWASAPAPAGSRSAAIPLASRSAAAPGAVVPGGPARVDPWAVAVGAALIVLGMPALRCRRRSGRRSTGRGPGPAIHRSAHRGASPNAHRSPQPWTEGRAGGAR